VGERAVLPVGGVGHLVPDLKKLGVESLHGGVFMSLEKGSHILLKGTCTVSGPEVRFVVLGSGVVVVQVVQLGDQEVAQASAPRVIAIGSVGVGMYPSGGAGGAQLDQVLARGKDIKQGVVVISVDMNMGVDQVVSLSIEGSCCLVLSLLCRGVQVGILSGRVEKGGEGGFSGGEGVHQVMKGWLSGPHDHLWLSEELLLPLEGNSAIYVGSVMGDGVAVVDIGLYVVGKGGNGGPLDHPDFDNGVVCCALGPIAREGSDAVLGSIEEVHEFFRDDRGGG